MISHLGRYLAAIFIFLAGAPALAHNSPGTAALLDLHSGNVGLELDIPLDQLELGFRRPLMDAPTGVKDRLRTHGWVQHH